MTAELLKEFEPQIAAFALTPSDGGRFQVSVNDELVYSKLHTGRHVNPGEIKQLVRKYIEEYHLTK
ncbi:MAG: Rdx family protein [Chloroflexi bacterium]|nr:Rdx family protein [Chloroflexota bacterium]MBU1661619.1 Rdx family protein [Chloroflexota bacterium]